MESEGLERIRLLWEGDAVEDTNALWGVFIEMGSDLSHLVDRIEGAGRRDPALECQADTLAAMRAIADECNA